MNIWRALELHDLEELPAGDLEHFKALCAYQVQHNPDHRLRPGFARLKNAATLTYGNAAALAPFMVSP